MDKLTCHNYTKALNAQLYIGKLPPGNINIPGGPYTIPQILIIVIGFFLLICTRFIWFPLNGVIMGILSGLISFILPYGISFVWIRIKHRSRTMSEFISDLMSILEHLRSKRVKTP